PSAGGTDAASAPGPRTPPAAGLPTPAPWSGRLRPAGRPLPAALADDRPRPGLSHRDDPRPPPRPRVAPRTGAYGDGVGARSGRVRLGDGGATGDRDRRLVPHPQADAERHRRAPVPELPAQGAAV